MPAAEIMEFGKHDWVRDDWENIPTASDSVPWSGKVHWLEEKGLHGADIGTDLVSGNHCRRAEQIFGDGRQKSCKDNENFGANHIQGRIRGDYNAVLWMENIQIYHVQEDTINY